MDEVISLIVCDKFQRILSHENIKDEEETFDPDCFDQNLNKEGYNKIRRIMKKDGIGDNTINSFNQHINYANNS